jgi:hypothetical protein
MRVAGGATTLAHCPSVLVGIARVAGQSVKSFVLAGRQRPNKNPFGMIPLLLRFIELARFARLKFTTGLLLQSMIDFFTKIHGSETAGCQL